MQPGSVKDNLSPAVWDLAIRATVRILRDVAPVTQASGRLVVALKCVNATSGIPEPGISAASGLVSTAGRSALQDVGLGHVVFCFLDFAAALIDD